MFVALYLFIIYFNFQLYLQNILSLVPNEEDDKEIYDEDR